MRFTSLGNFIDDFYGARHRSDFQELWQSDPHYSATMFAPYIQDTWRIKNNLTLTMGLRYEYWGALGERTCVPGIQYQRGRGPAECHRS